MRKFFVFTIIFVVVSLLTGCSRAASTEPIPTALSEERVAEIAAQAAANAIASIPEQEIPEPLTAEEVSSIAAQAAAEAVASIPQPESLTEEQVSAIIADALAKEETKAQEALSQYVIPLSWFESQGLVFSSGKTVAYLCETGARAWQGEINFNVVPTDANIEVVEINCIQYNPGEEIPQDELITMGGVGTIWFRLPIETTLNQFGDCPCGIDGDC